MIHIVLQKIKNQKWLNLCLFMGILLITAMFSCHPMLEKGAGSGILQRAFADYEKENQKYPAILQRNGAWKKIKNKKISALEKGMDVYVRQWQEYIDTGTVAGQRFMTLRGGKADSNLGGKNYYLKFTYLKDMEAYAEVVKGEDFKKQTSGEYACFISESLMDAYGFVAGEQLNFPYLTNDKNERLTLTIAGICKEKDIQNAYWENSLSDFEKTVFLTENTFEEVLKNYDFEELEFTDTVMLDYTKINSTNVGIYESYLAQFEKLDAAFSSNLKPQFEDYHTKQKKVRMILMALELICIVLLYLFLYMVSSRLLSTWEGEIAVLRSRGASVRQIILLYFLHALFLSGVAFIPGIGTGYLLCKCGAGTDGFLQFTDKPLGLYRFCPEMIFYALFACLSVVLFLTVPVFKLAKQTIVQKKKRQERKKPLWYFSGLDLILTGISIYLFQGFYRQRDLIALDMIAGKKTDPMLFLNVTLFIFACGLLFLRAGYGIICLFFASFKRRGSVGSYAAFLQMKRTWFSHGMIGIFLMMTVASGIVNSAMARTISENMQNRITCNTGADMRCKEKWKIRMAVDSEGTITGWAYNEPDFGRFQEISKDIKATRVLTDNNIQVNGKTKKAENVFFMGIHTKEFGETALLPGEGSEHHWYLDLNELAKQPEGVIISSNLANELEVSVGDLVTFTRYSPVKKDEELGSASGKVCAIVNEFPGYEKYRYETSEQGEIKETETCLLVCNYTQAVTQFPLTPYEVWMKFSSPDDADKVHKWETDNNITMETKELEQEISDSRNEPVVQITNGMFTLSFLISMLVCSLGYLIYWMMSVGSRQTLFGIYRAMGMRLKEIKQMLWLEQLFCSALFAAAGMGTGVFAARLFIPVTALVYLPEKHSLPFITQLYATDLVQILAVTVTLGIICIFVLFQKVRHMRIAQTLRLGDDS